ncbi:hypothetical protein [Devosia sp.]|uniref:hypothetical protein n=1 Tax=Devosia sp. TaxID=1871048 RepID=UPI003263EB21
MDPYALAVREFCKMAARPAAMLFILISLAGCSDFEITETSQAQSRNCGFGNCRQNEVCYNNGYCRPVQQQGNGNWAQRYGQMPMMRPNGPPGYGNVYAQRPGFAANQVAQGSYEAGAGQPARAMNGKNPLAAGPCGALVKPTPDGVEQAAKNPAARMPVC